MVWKLSNDKLLDVELQDGKARDAAFEVARPVNRPA